MTPWAIEQAVFDLEEVRIVIRAPANESLPGDYRFSRKAASNTTISEWIQQRIVPVIGAHTVVVVDGNGQIPHGRTKMETLRASYIR